MSLSELVWGAGGGKGGFLEELTVFEFCWEEGRETEEPPDGLGPSLFGQCLDEGVVASKRSAHSQDHKQ